MSYLKRAQRRYLLVGGNIKTECLLKMTLRNTAQCATGRHDVQQLTCVEQLNSTYVTTCATRRLLPMEQQINVCVMNPKPLDEDLHPPDVAEGRSPQAHGRFHYL